LSEMFSFFKMCQKDSLAKVSQQNLLDLKLS